MTTAWVPLATTTLSSSASDITFSSINTATYRDLILVAKAKSTSSAYDQAINFNGDTNAGNYSCVIAYGNGSTYSSTTSSFIIDFYGSVTTDNTNVTILQILDAGASDKHTTYLSRANRASSGVDMVAGRWANTAAITSLRYFLNGGTLDAGTVVSLYGSNRL
jgi:hypothetical protein